ncbi:MAG: SulP family inorganic anion transporter, partial [Glaciecola sp.]|nr:SulP family inorganic anion transporter [Glaciecola sp.]
IQSGGRTALSGVFRVLVLIVAVFGAASLIEMIPLAVLAGIAVKVGVDILDWSFIKRAHRVSRHSTVIMYAVLLLTVFVDLIVAVGIGVFIANVITIEKLSASQSKNIKAMSDVDDRNPLDPAQRKLLNQAQGKVLFFYLSGAMIFGVSKALARERKNIQNHEVVIIDLSDVSMLDDTITLSLENVIEEALDLNKTVYVVVKTAKAKEKLQNLGLHTRLREEDFTQSRTAALEMALLTVKGSKD